MLFVPERRRSSRLQSAIRSERSEPLNPGSRADVPQESRERSEHQPQRRAVLRRREGTCFSSPSDDEVVGFKARSAPRCSRSRSAGGTDETRREVSWLVGTVVSSDSAKTAAPRRTSQRAERAIRESERSERSNQS